MSKARESKAEYNTDGAGQEVRNDAPAHKFFLLLPNMLDDSDLDPYERTLYLHYVRVGSCWESVDTTRLKTQMSAGKVSETRRKLQEKGWITVSVSQYGTMLITIVDRWAENIAKYSQGETPSLSESHPSPHETPPSRSETKKNPIKKNQNKNIYIAPPENLPVKEKTLQDEGYGVFIKEISRRVRGITPPIAEKAGELWDEYDDLDAHIHALEQTDKYANGFNLKYYEQCLSSWWAKHKGTNGHS